MKTNCNIIQDLMPLYVDGDCSAEAKALVEEHLGECPACRHMCRQMGMPVSIPASGNIPPASDNTNPASGSNDPASMDITPEQVIPDAFRKIRRSNLIRTIAIGAALFLMGCFIMNSFALYSQNAAAQTELDKEYRVMSLWSLLKEGDVEGFLASLDSSAYYDKACESQLGSSGLSPYNMEDQMLYNFGKVKNTLQLGDSTYISCLEETSAVKTLADLIPLWEKYTSFVLTEQDYQEITAGEYDHPALARMISMEWNGKLYYYYSPDGPDDDSTPDAMLTNPKTGESMGIYTSSIYDICRNSHLMPEEMFEAYEEEAAFYQQLFTSNAEAFSETDKDQFQQLWLGKTREHVEKLLAENGPLTMICAGERGIFNENEYPEDTVFAERLLVFANDHAVVADSHMGLDNDHMYVEFLRGIKPDVEIQR